MKAKQKAKEIEYIDATPAAGKTREARRLIINHIATNASHIVVYAAPTHKLLDEVTLGLKDATMEGRFEKRVVRIQPGKKEAPALQYGYLLGLVSEKEAKHGLRNRPDLFAYLKGMKGKCRIILCTHECLIRANKGESKESAAATVIFDEARNCVLRDLEVKVSKQALDHISEVFNLAKTGASKKEVEVDGGKYSSSLFTLDGKSFPTPQALMAKFNVSELKDLPDYVRSLYAMKSTCVGGRADILIEVLTPINGKTGQKAYIVGLSRPSSIFEGYGRVIVMSAYFTHSQMYHLLLNAHVGHQRGAQSFTLVPYRTSKDFRERSRTITANSLKNIRIGALLTGTRSGRLTSTFLSTGLVVTPAVNTALRERATLKKAEIIERAFSKKEVPGLTQKENSMLHACGNPPLLSLHRLAYEVFRDNDIKAALCFTNAFEKSSVGSLYKMGGAKVMDTVAFLKNANSSLEDSHYKKQRALLTKSMLTHLKEASSKIFFTIPESTSVLGLNKYDHLDGFVHLAALNPKPAVARMLKRVLPNYEPDLDYAISNIVQTMYRTSLRKPESREEVVCLVLTEWIIGQIERVCFNGKELRRIEGYEPRFTELDYVAQDKEAKAKAGSAGGSGKKLDIPDEVRKQIQKLQTRASVVTKEKLRDKIAGLKQIAKTYPEARINIRKWIAKHAR